MYNNNSRGGHVFVMFLFILADQVNIWIYILFCDGFISVLADQVNFWI